jgi:hypothetical protein
MSISRESCAAKQSTQQLDPATVFNGHGMTEPESENEDLKLAVLKPALLGPKGWRSHGRDDAGKGASTANTR